MAYCTVLCGRCGNPIHEIFKAEAGYLFIVDGLEACVIVLLHDLSSGVQTYASLILSH